MTPTTHEMALVTSAFDGIDTELVSVSLTGASDG